MTANLATLRAEVERELASLPIPITAEGHEGLVEKRAYWSELKELLAREPVPELRECPTCKHIGARALSHCGYCGSLLERQDAVAALPR
jgi:hypothetical protein